MAIVQNFWTSLPCSFEQELLRLSKSKLYGEQLVSLLEDLTKESTLRQKQIAALVFKLPVWARTQHTAFATFQPNAKTFPIKMFHPLVS